MARSTPIDIDWAPDRTSDEPVTRQIVDYMCGRIASGAWPIGSRLPSQRTMAERFGVNRSTIIAAIEELADYGIVEGRRGGGTRIVSNTWSLMLPGAPDWPTTSPPASSRRTTRRSRPSTVSNSTRR